MALAVLPSDDAWRRRRLEAFAEVLAVVGDGTHAVVALLDGQGQLELLVGAGLK